MKTEINTEEIEMQPCTFCADFTHPANLTHIGQGRVCAECVESVPALAGVRIDSIAIRGAFGGPVIIGHCGEGDKRLTLIQDSVTGREAIQTNGDPIWEDSEGFAEVREEILG